MRQVNEPEEATMESVTTQPYNADQLRFMRKAHEGLQQALHDLHTGQPLRLSVTDPVSAARERVAKAIDILAKAIQEA